MTKKCKNCGVTSEKYHAQSSLCNTCRNKKLANKRKEEKLHNPARYLLHKSCKRAVERGRENYTKKSYAHVSCQWNKPLDMLNALMKNKNFWESWQKQTDIYIKSNEEKGERPTIDRIDENGNYELSNIQVLPMQLNGIKGSSNECQVMLVKDLRPVKVLEFDSIKEANLLLGIPYNIVNTGQIQRLNFGDDYKAIIESPKSKNRVDSSPQYLMVVNYRQTVKSNNGERYIITTQEKKYVNGIRLTEKR